MSVSTAQYMQLCSRGWDWQRTLDGGERFVVFDTEATGADSRMDQLVSIGAVAVVGNSIQLEDVFEMILKVSYNSATVLVHGVTRELAAEAGEEEATALAAFLDYIGDGILVAHHASFDRTLLNKALQKHFGHDLLNPLVDTGDLAKRLGEAGA
ncbi:MAG: 3'-5' exonuclease, partial [Opitutales bacterium]